MEKLLITGAGGFIGSHLAEQCVRLGYHVRAFVRYNSLNRWGWLEQTEYKNEIEIVSGDIRDYDSVLRAAKGCAAVFHLAALIGIPYSYISPLAYIRTNVEGTYNVLESARQCGLSNILVTSTSETYGTAQYVPIDEKHPLVGQSPYSATKIAADQLAVSFHRSFDLPIKIVRPFNAYGPRQSARAVITTIIVQLLSGNQRVNLGNISSSRDLTFVNDTVDGFIEIFRCDKLIGEVTNIGSGQEISVKTLAGMIGDIMGLEFEICSETARIRPADSEVERLVCDNSKIKEYTPWRPKHDLKAGLTKTVEWLRSNLSWYKSGIYNI